MRKLGVCGLYLLAAGALFSSRAVGQEKPECDLSRADSAFLAGRPLYRDCAVDQAAELMDVDIPLDFRPTRGGTYSASIRFVLDTAGTPERNTMRVVRNTSWDYAQALMAAVPRVRYRPARKDGLPVRQLVTLDRSLTIKVERR